MCYEFKRSRPLSAIRMLSILYDLVLHYKCLISQKTNLLVICNRPAHFNITVLLLRSMCVYNIVRVHCCVCQSQSCSWMLLPSRRLVSRLRRPLHIYMKPKVTSTPGQFRAHTLVTLEACNSTQAKIRQYACE